MPSAVNNPGALTTFGNSLGVKFSSAEWYLDWSDDFTPSIARGFNGQGAIPQLIWQPEIGSGGVSFDDVTSGKYDNYINNFAQDVRNLGTPIRISLAPEMNSSWEPWGVGNNGNNADNFKAFWQYTVNCFRAQGANNVSWVWAPNIHYWGEPSSYGSLFPGSAYVDCAGLDGYNWGTTQDSSSWQSFSNVFRASYNDIINVTGKDVILTEIASTEQGGDKAQWILDMFRDIRSSFPRIKGINWFNVNKETDWRINSSAASTNAFIQGARGNYGSAVNNQPTNNAQSSTKNSQNTNTNKTTTNGQTDNQANDQTNETPLSTDTSYVLPSSKTSFYDSETGKDVLGAETFRSKLQTYFTKDNILLFMIAVKLFLTAIKLFQLIFFFI